MAVNDSWQYRDVGVFIRDNIYLHRCKTDIGTCAGIDTMHTCARMTTVMVPIAEAKVNHVLAMCIVVYLYIYIYNFIVKYVA